MAKSMYAINILEHGSESELRMSETPLPEIGDGDVLVEIEAAGINPSDALSARGGFPDSKLPRILGRDFAGTVVEGPVELVGELVWGSGGDLGITRDGTHAEYISIPKAAVSLRPRNLTADEAAAVGVPFQTAWSALVERGGLRAGECVVISGANGAVGSASLQIATALGAKVIALVKSADDDSRVLPGKAAAIAHLDSSDLPQIVRELTSGKGADLAINAIGEAAFQPLIDVLSEYGRMSIFSVVSGQYVTLDLKQLYRANINLFGVNTASIDVVNGALILDRLRPFFESGAIAAPTIAGRFPLSRAAEAYQCRTNGKIVLIPDRLFGG